MTDPTPIVADFVITEAEIAKYVKPFAVDYGGQELVLKAVKSLAIDDLLEVSKTAEGSVLQALSMVAANEFTLTALRSMPHPLLFKVFGAWEDSGDVELGESDGSEASSTPTEQQ